MLVCRQEAAGDTEEKHFVYATIMDQVLVFERAISEMTPAAPAMARLMSERAES